MEEINENPVPTWQSCHIYATQLRLLLPRRPQQKGEADTSVVEPMPDNDDNEVSIPADEDFVTLDYQQENYTADNSKVDATRFCHATTQTHYEEVNEIGITPRDRLTSIQRYKVNLQQKKRVKRQSPNTRPRNIVTRPHKPTNPLSTKSIIPSEKTINKDLHTPLTKNLRPAEISTRRHTSPVLERRQNAIRSHALQMTSDKRRNTMQVIPEIRISSY